MTVRIPLTEAQKLALEYAGAQEHDTTAADRALVTALIAEEGKLVFEPRDAGMIRSAINELDAVGGMEEGFDPEYSDEWKQHCETLAELAANVGRYESHRPRAHRADDRSR